VLSLAPILSSAEGVANFIGEMFAFENSSSSYTRCQFHQLYTRAFFVRMSFSLVTCKLPKRRSYKKFVCRTLMKLTAGVARLF